MSTHLNEIVKGLTPKSRAALTAPATDPARPPVVLARQPAAWQALYYAESPLTGDRWMELPLHSVVPTQELRAGQEWDVVDARLTEQGLKRYGFTANPDNGPVAVSARHALALARERWEEEGPHSAWFQIFANEEPFEDDTATHVTATNGNPQDVMFVDVAALRAFADERHQPLV
ncbi:hypothetical protein ABT024_05115 [Streptomyces sp. NPDC002812]|uniref:hypothetical protein n=1 Tax=Streptomyces sp. NPDC002812 TaxID=3154434 RepID=UPI00332EA9B8